MDGDYVVAHVYFRLTMFLLSSIFVLSRSCCPLPWAATFKEIDQHVKVHGQLVAEDIDKERFRATCLIGYCGLTWTGKQSRSPISWVFNMLKTHENTQSLLTNACATMPASNGNDRQFFRYVLQRLPAFWAPSSWEGHLFREFNFFRHVSWWFFRVFPPTDILDHLTPGGFTQEMSQAAKKRRTFGWHVQVSNLHKNPGYFLGDFFIKHLLRIPKKNNQDSMERNFVAQVKGLSKVSFLYRIHGTIVYLPIHWYHRKSTIRLGRYISSMDPMGCGLKINDSDSVIRW